MPVAPSLEDPGVLARRKERAEFETRVRKNERLAAEDPVGYRRRLRRLVALGYVFIGSMLVLALGLTFGMVLLMATGHSFGGGLRLLILGLALVYAILRSLWVKIERPEGFDLPRDRYPGLWREVEAIADALKAPRPDEILLDEEFNASAAQWPRFGILGGYRQTLTLGLPLLAALSPEEARAVIAHEFGHFSGSHGRFGVWIYRVNQTWEQLGQNLQRAGYASLLFRPFVKWFAPRFAATSFAIRRQHEFEADRASVEVAGAETVARTLVRLAPLSDHLDRTFWKPHNRSLAKTAVPTPGFSSRMVESMRIPIDPPAAARRIDFVLAQPTDYDDTHPSLSDRLAALGQPSPRGVPEAPVVSAAEWLFGDSLDGLVRDFDAYYTTRGAAVWKALGERRDRMVKRVEELSAREAVLIPIEIVELAFLRTELSGTEDPVPAYRELLARLPDSSDAAYLLGSALLDGDDEEGVALVRSAGERNPDLADDARNDLAGFYARRGETAQVAELREEALDAFDRRSVAESATGITLTDELLAPEATDEERRDLVQIVERLKGLGWAYLFRKRLPATGELRLYLALVPKPTAYVGEDGLSYFTRQLSKLGEAPVAITVVFLPNTKKWRWRLNEVKGALIFDAKVDRTKASQ